MTSSHTYLFILVVSILIVVTDAADRSKFKTCEQSSFCQRNRNHKPHEQQWNLDSNTVRQSGRNVEAELLDENDPSVRLLLLLSLTTKGAIRMKIDQLNPTRARFEAKEALNPSLSFKQLNIAEKNEDKLVFRFGATSNPQSNSEDSEYKLILTAKPFKAEVLDKSGNVVVLVNSRGLMRFEVHKETQSASVDPSMFGAPREAKAYDPAGRPIEEGESNAEQADSAPNDELQKSETQQADQPEAMAQTAESYAETFSTFTDIRPYGPMSVGVDIHFPNSDHVYGIPEHADSFNLRDTRPNIGDPYRLYNVDIFEYETNSPMSLYGAIPFMITHSKSVGSFGIFWLNPSETWIDIESNHSQSRGAGVVDMLSSLVSSDKKMTGRLTHWFSETGLIDLWLMPGPDPLKVIEYNAEALGTIPMPPMYSIGFHQCRWNYFSGEEVMQVESGYDAVDIPLDAIWLDIEYTAARAKRYFTWDPITFPKPVELANNLTSRGRRLIAIIDPHIKKENGYSLYDEGSSSDYWIKDASGQNAYEGWCWPGASVWPDYLDPKVREWWSEKFNPAHFPGDQNSIVDIWNDMNEPSVFNGPEVSSPRDLRFKGGWEFRDIHNMYGFLMTKATFEGMSKYRVGLDRPFVLTRSFFAGSQRYCAAWTGDNQASWDHLRMTIPMLLSLSVSGMPNVGADVGGFFNNPEDELMVRWNQAGAFQPFFRNHAHLDARHRELYMYEGHTLDLLRAAIRLRYSYSPYWYTLFFEAHSVGLPMMRPLWLHEPQDESTYGIEDQHLVGYALLVRPVMEKGATSVNVYLPGAGGQSAWFDLKNHVMYPGGTTINYPVDLRTVPLFQRAGTIIPRSYRMRRSLELLAPEPVTLDIVLGENGGKSYARGSLYVDQFKRLQPDVESATLKDILYYDEYLYVRPSTNATLAHGVIERIVIYNWPASKKIVSILDAPEENNYTNAHNVEYKFDHPKQDGTVLLEIKRPQRSHTWRTWTLKIDVAA